MAKTLNFRLNGNRFSLIPAKVERKKLYGWSELQVYTPDDQQCIPTGLNSDGVTLIPPGATKTGMISDSGEWMDRSDLVAITTDGNEATAIPSSFDQDIELTEKADINELLDCNINAVYQIYGDEAVVFAGILGNDIYKFQFSYRGGYESSVAFIIAKDDNLFVLTGEKRKYELLALSQEGVIDNDEEFAIDEDLDFGMM